jgi:DtxR family Mn-dependent transcriptional regulator
MRRLSELGLINYVQREYIDLTPDGERHARRVLAKHQMLTRFFVEILGMPSDLAERDACSMEHSLSPVGMDHLVRFFEFLKCCPGGDKFLERYHRCSLTATEAAHCDMGCPALADQLAPEEEAMSLMNMKPGESARVTQINGAGAIRQRLLDMGLLPDVLIEVQRVAPAGDPIWIKLQGFQLSLRKSEAAAVLVEASK